MKHTEFSLVYFFLCLYYTSPFSLTIQKPLRIPKNQSEHTALI